MTEDRLHHCDIRGCGGVGIEVVHRPETVHLCADHLALISKAIDDSRRHV